MGTVTAVSERTITGVTPEQVFALLADYHDGRPKILTDAYSDYRIEQGGFGEGTVVSYRLQAAKRERPYRLEVTEPGPGLLREADTDSTFATTWTVEPGDGGALVKVESSWQGAGGIGGFFEGFFAPKGLGRLYDDVLARRADVVADPPEEGAAGGEEQACESPALRAGARRARRSGPVHGGAGRGLVC